MSKSDCQVQIVGICLVHNEDVFLDRVLRNIAGVCDQILIADNQSTDGTARIGQEWAKRVPSVIYRRVRLASESHEMIRPFANTPTWVFPVDGDEIYDPAGLNRMRTTILSGACDAFRQIYGNVLHCNSLDTDRGIAAGYLAPPSRTMTKLYNFNAIYDWEGPCMEKCLGGTIRFKPGYSSESNRYLMNEYDWESSPFRCLHTVFLKRSSRQKEGERGRPNIPDIMAMGWKGQLIYHFRRFFGDSGLSRYKHDMYRRGDLVQKDVRCFFPALHGTTVAPG